MGPVSKPIGIIATLLIGVFSVRHSGADPILVPPAPGRLSWGGAEAGFIVFALGEARILGVAGSRRLSGWPDRRLAIEGGNPALAAARAGAMVHFRCAPVSLVMQADLAELDRPELPDTAVLVASLVDDAYLLWRPARPVWLYAGRHRVTWSKLRQFHELELPLGAVPLVIDRLAPDRRFGITLAGDLGSVSYTAGVWEDLDRLEPRYALDDPSREGAVLASGHLEWTPRAPMSGSNPPGRISGGRGPAPTPRADPWFGTSRPSLGLGGLWRRRTDGTTRLDLALALQWKWRGWSAVVEGLTATSAAAIEDSAHAELMFAPIDRVLLTGFGEWDGGLGLDGTWTAGVGATAYATSDRKNKIAFVGWFRRDADRGTAYDAAVLLLQAAL